MYRETTKHGVTLNKAAEQIKGDVQGKTHMSTGLLSSRLTSSDPQAFHGEHHPVSVLHMCSFLFIKYFHVLLRIANFSDHLDVLCSRSSYGLWSMFFAVILKPLRIFMRVLA